MTDLTEIARVAAGLACETAIVGAYCKRAVRDHILVVARPQSLMLVAGITLATTPFIGAHRHD